VPSSFHSTTAGIFSGISIFGFDFGDGGLVCDFFGAKLPALDLLEVPSFSQAGFHEESGIGNPPRPEIYCKRMWHNCVWAGDGICDSKGPHQRVGAGGVLVGLWSEARHNKQQTQMKMGVARSPYCADYRSVISGPAELRNICIRESFLGVCSESFSPGFFRKRKPISQREFSLRLKSFANSIPTKGARRRQEKNCQMIMISNIFFVLGFQEFSSSSSTGGGASGTSSGLGRSVLAALSLTLLPGFFGANLVLAFSC
jgi:hypothetical protein